jgi:hypothetical protein
VAAMGTSELFAGISGGFPLAEGEKKKDDEKSEKKVFLLSFFLVESN